ncbi:MAG: glycosyltransferase family 90 protein [Pseudoflavonifractor sp.]|nr:glycosyltransferase family 90 protein [Pseudoflavonifractor sp.]
MSLLYDLHNGKNAKLPYFVKAFARELIPARHPDIRAVLDKSRSRRDWPYILDRVNYYCKTQGPPESADRRVCDIARDEQPSTYWHDLREYMRPFPRDTRINWLPGDITTIPPVPSITKSRPIAGDNANSVLLKLDKIRHFTWVDDKTDYADKLSGVVFRGKVPGKPKRIRFFDLYFGDPRVDLGDSSRHGNPAWHTPKMTLAAQLRYKWILALEGFDVASNLKWVMSSQSVAVMPEPEFETWYMEGRLIPDVHYLRIAADYSDLHERLDMLEADPAMARRIITEANRWTMQFRDERRERLIATLVIAKYLGLINPGS